MSPLLLLLCAQVSLARLSGTRRRLVTKRPKRDLKVYMYKLEKTWSADEIVHQLETHRDIYWKRNNCGWNRHVCKEKTWEKEYSTFRQYGADVTIIEKFKHYENLVTNPKDADLFLVPYPHSSQCRAPPHGEVWAHCGGVSREYTKKMVRSLKHLTPTTRDRHFFLLTGDWGNNHEHLEDMPLYASLGGFPNYYRDHPIPPGVTNIVIPPPVLEPEYQPSVLARTNWTRQRKYSVYMNAGLVSYERREFSKILNSVSSVGGLPTYHTEIAGHRDFALPPSKIWENYRNTMFCPVLKGDLPFQKRFYDVSLSGCLPVVVTTPAWDFKKTKCNSWWSWSAPNYVETHAFARGGRTKRRGMSIDYRDFVVEVNGVKNIIPTLEKILKDKKKLHAMQEALGRNARKMVYGLGEDMYAEGDAFDELLGRLEMYVEGKKPGEIRCD